MLKSPMRTGFAALLALLLGMAVAHAAGSPLGIGTAEPSFQPMGGPLAPVFAFINEKQAAFYRALTLAIEAMRHDPWKLGGLVGLSFAYGIFHAAGPGHGKAVISSYMVANEVELRRGILISFIASLLQGVVAVLVVGCAYLVLRGSGITLTQATNTLETISFALVVLFGCWLLFRKLRALWKARPARQAMPLATAGGSLQFAFAGPADATLTNPLRFQPTESSSRFQCDDGTATPAGELCLDCGRAHMPDPSMMKGETFSLSAAWSAILAVGLRPCSGAILVMTFSILNGLLLGGLLSVLAMSIGTALTVCALASLAVAAKGIAIRLAGRRSVLSGRLTNAIEIGGAIFVIVIGLLLLGASLEA